MAEHAQGIESVGHFLAVAAERADNFVTNMGRVIDIVQTPGRKYQEFLEKTVGTPEQQADKYAKAYGDLSTKGSAVGQWWQRNMPTWLGGQSEPSGANPARPGGPMGGWENGVGPSSDRSIPRGIRNNNPTNLTYVPGQQGVIGSDGRFGRYADMRDGVGAALRQLQLYQQRGLASVTSMINTWAPPSENDSRAYVRRVASAMGIDPNAPVNLQDPEVAARMIGAMSQVENGRDVNPRLIREGVNRALGRDDEDGLPIIPGSQRSSDRRTATLADVQAAADRSAAPAASSGNLQITIDHQNVPAGVTMTPKLQASSAEIAGVRVRRAMPEAGAAPAFGGLY